MDNVNEPIVLPYPNDRETLLLLQLQSRLDQMQSSFNSLTNKVTQLESEIASLRKAQNG